MVNKDSEVMREMGFDNGVAGVSFARYLDFEEPEIVAVRVVSAFA